MKKKKLVLVSAAVAALAFAPAFAADMPVKAQRYMPRPPAFSWTGCYIGGNVGRLWAHTLETDQTPTSPFFGQTADTVNANDWLGGVQGGCDYQVGGWVFGVGGDYDWSNAYGTAANGLSATPRTDSLRVKSLASVTGRAGYAWQRFLAYVKGGAAWQRNDYATFTNATGALFVSASETDAGWTVGAGAEYSINDWLSAFAEYDHYDFGSHSLVFTCATPGCGPGGASTALGGEHVTDNVFKVGLNLRWGFKQ
jgi:outer membrane immunogenic protein